uniref:Uncharacterized protein n=1 Tax=mine drainage metagenome TaxID=410659 RepID=E6PZM3_9ZZZZ
MITFIYPKPIQYFLAQSDPEESQCLESTYNFSVTHLR